MSALVDNLNFFPRPVLGKIEKKISRSSRRLGQHLILSFLVLFGSVRVLFLVPVSVSILVFLVPFPVSVTAPVFLCFSASICTFFFSLPVSIASIQLFGFFLLVSSLALRFNRRLKGKTLTNSIQLPCRRLELKVINNSYPKFMRMFWIRYPNQAWFPFAFLIGHQDSCMITKQIKHKITSTLILADTVPVNF